MSPSPLRRLLFFNNTDLMASPSRHSHLLLPGQQLIRLSPSNPAPSLPISSKLPPLRHLLGRLLLPPQHETLPHLASCPHRPCNTSSTPQSLLAPPIANLSSPSKLRLRLPPMPQQLHHLLPLLPPPLIPLPRRRLQPLRLIPLRFFSKCNWTVNA